MVDLFISDLPDSEKNPDPEEFGITGFY